jgi:mannitol-1-/sugar-/sorbitol-6-phosphatase
VGVAQLVERRTVAPNVAGSNPVSHPILSPCKFWHFFETFFPTAMTIIRCDAVLFDMDGVLVDSTPAVARVWATWAQAHGFVPEEVVRKAHGRPSLATVRELLPDGDHSTENRWLEQAEIADISDVVALPGAFELLRSIAPERWAVVTSATRPLAEVRLRAAGLPVTQNLVTATDLERGKPWPDPYLKGAEILRIAPAECIVAEDAPSGVHAGKAAGARVLALRTTSTDEELLNAGANWLADDLSAVSLQPSQNGAVAFTLRTKETK